MQSYHSSTHRVVIPCPYCPEALSQVRNWKRHILKIHSNRIAQQSNKYDDVYIDNANYSISNELDTGFDSQGIDCENYAVNDKNPFKTNSVHPDSEFINDLNHENKEQLNNVEERLRLNILRLIINLKSNNATETCIDICSKDLLDVLSEYKEVNTEVYFNNIRKTTATNAGRQKFISDHINVIQPKSIILGYSTIEQLETDGLSIIIDQKAYVFQGSLFLVCGDLLGLAQIHGFKCAFRQGWKPLFYCDVNRDGLRRINKGSDCQLRTLDKYEKNYMAIEFATGLEKTKLQKKFGIISYSPLRKIRNFDIFQQTAIDIMHVLLEGICQRELKLLFKQIHHEKFATLVSLSTMIRSFQYGSSESSPSNKFNLLSEENEVKFRLSASEMFTLIKYIPLVFYQARLLQSICTSSYWLSFLQLREIVSISFASEIDTTTIKQLEKLVTRYLITFDNAYGYVQRLPKHHLLVHLGDQMDRFGPLRFTSCMIFEKKHSFFKKMKYRNFRNIAVTLARRRQHYIAAQMYTSNNTSTSSFLYSGHKIQKVKELHSSAATQHHLLDSKRTLYETRQVTLFGITYAVGDVVLINDYIFPIDRVFGKILIVIVQDKVILLRLQLLQVISFNQQLCIYELCLLDCSVTKNIYDLKHIWPMRVLKISESLFVSLFPYGRTNLISIE
ncbi:unnamed protein product [Rotaria sp. Silwood1]|nr:unnamed protein product [Rotaria sp. Silwood1]CAF4981378.1 unnamed protein product [Rotaria sp. Silwood1]